MSSIKDAVLAYARTTYRTEPDAPFSTAPTYLVLRHPDSRKWFALFMDLPRSRLGLSGEEVADVLNLKCGAVLSGSLRTKPGFLPAYHMHRENWITILLDGTALPEDIFPLLDLSYSLTKKKKLR